ncbi:MAG TPA: hypothetical protein V6D50_10715 [Chroococcales cyanobacterium]|jgi:hypothetical protein
MSQEIINLTLLLVNQEFEDILKEYPVEPYQLAFSIPELRRRLMNCILNQTPNYYTLLEDRQSPPEDPKFLYSSSAEEMRMKNLIRQSIVHTFRENADWVSDYLPQTCHLDFNLSKRSVEQ